MAGSPDLAPILEMLNATRASARERQGEIERKIRAEARKLNQGDAAGQCNLHSKSCTSLPGLQDTIILCHSGLPCRYLRRDRVKVVY